ncbi:MAG: ABC transporter permease [Solirubrobacterales bacterium]
MSADSSAAAVRVSPPVHEYPAAELPGLIERMPDRVAGPRAIGGSTKRFLRLTWMLAYLDFKLKFFGSVLGYAWQLVRPLMLFAVLYVVFSQILRFGDTPNYPVVLLSGIVIFSFFSDATNSAVGSIVEREGLVRKIAFPLLTCPLASVTSLFLTLVLNYLVVIGFALAVGIVPGVRWIEIIPLLALLYFVTAAVGTGLSAVYVRFRDVRPIWEVISQVLFYASPVIYPIEFIPNPTLQKLIMCNPVAMIIEQLRHATVDPSAPSVVHVFGNWWMLAIPLGITVLLAVFGFMAISRMAPRVAEEM